FLLGIIGLFLFYRDKLEIRKSISDKKKKLADISSIVLTSTVVYLQIYRIIDNSEKYPQGFLEEPLIQIFPIILLITSLLILVLLIISVISSLQEYKSYLIFKRNKIVSNRRLDFEKIFENDNRKKIIENILFSPGIHFKELLRECFLQRGQLQWHLKVLLEYGIIKSKKIGQYITYFPCYEDLDSRKYNIKLMKSETSMKILSLIAKFPGINPSTIAEKIGIKKNTVNYHINKMKKSELIVSQKEGRNLKIYLIEEISIEL
ncbi:MAG: winged helix-turn-helix transcriptional regulator, partial [Candidatus Lokiarchaeota archaeon]|nr:winged helix-turn-helix transcriptional regulator [Candidatus Lokiarchaeota archaeon]